MTTLEQLKELLALVGKAADMSIKLEDDVDGLEKITSGIIHYYEKVASRIDAMELQNPTRMAIVTKDFLLLKDVQQYLPSNYGAFRRPDGRIQITGRDNKGWTLDGYVLPRLESGLIPAREFTSMEDEARMHPQP